MLLKILKNAARKTENMSVEEENLKVVQRNGNSIYWIKNPSPELQMAAVQQAGRVIQWIKNPSPEVQMAAVRQNGMAIRYIQNPAPEVQIAALQQNNNLIDSEQISPQIKTWVKMFGIKQTKIILSTEKN